MQNFEKQMIPCKSTAEEVSFEWPHHRISFTDSKLVRTILDVSIIESGSERVICLSTAEDRPRACNPGWDIASVLADANLSAKCNPTRTYFYNPSRNIV